MSHTLDALPNQRAIGISSLVATSVLWGTTGTAQALAATSADPAVVGVSRLIFGGDSYS